LSLKINGLAQTVPVARQFWAVLVGSNAVDGALIDRPSASDQISGDWRSVWSEMGLGSPYASISMQLTESKMNVIEKTVFATEAVLNAVIDHELFVGLDLDRGSPSIAMDLYDLFADRFATNSDPIASDFAELLLKHADLIAVALELRVKHQQAQKWIKHKKAEV